MHRPDFKSMRNEMLRNGVSPRVVSRAIAELSDHYDDVRAELLHSGLPPDEASLLASDRLGQPAVLIRHISSRADLRSWIYRYPRAARVVLPAAFVLLLPAAPVFASAAHFASIVRWLACVLLSGVITAAMMLILQLSITLG